MSRWKALQAPRGAHKGRGEEWLWTLQRDPEFPLNAKQLGPETLAAVRGRRRRREQLARGLYVAAMVCAAGAGGVFLLAGGGGPLPAVLHVFGTGAIALTLAAQWAERTGWPGAHEERAWRRGWRSFSACDLGSPLTPFLLEELSTHERAEVVEVVVGISEGARGSVAELIQSAELILATGDERRRRVRGR